MPDVDEREDQNPESGTDDGGDGEGGADTAAELAKWKALARKHEKEAKEGKAAIARLKEIEDSNKSEVEKATEAQRQAEQRAAEAEQRALRLEVAASKGLTPAQAKRLQGSTLEELEADADELLSTFRSADQDDADTGSGLRRTPRERLRNGSGPVTEPEKTPEEIVAAIPRRAF